MVSTRNLTDLKRLFVNLLWPNDAIWNHRTYSLLAQVMACNLLYHCANHNEKNLHQFCGRLLCEEKLVYWEKFVVKFQSQYTDFLSVKHWPVCPVSICSICSLNFLYYLHKCICQVKWMGSGGSLPALKVHCSALRTLWEISWKQTQTNQLMRISIVFMHNMA